MRPCTALAGTPSPVRWFTPAAADQRRRLDAWCATVGTPIVHQPLTPSPSPTRQRIALVSWNVHVGGGDIAALTTDLRSGRLTAGETLPFVLLLQEAFRINDDVPVRRRGQPSTARIAPRPQNGPRVQTPDLARRLGLHLVYVPSMRNGPGDASHREDRGSAILSTMPLADPHAIELPFERQRRVAVAARIGGVTRDDDLWVLSVHLENRTGGRRFWLEAPSARARQARALVKKFLPDGPAILGGDTQHVGVRRADDRVAERRVRNARGRRHSRHAARGWAHRLPAGASAVGLDDDQPPARQPVRLGSLPCSWSPHAT